MSEPTPPSVAVCDDRRAWFLLRRLLDALLCVGLILLAPGTQSFALAQLTPAQELQQTAAEFERLTRALEASLAELPRDSFDPEAIVLDEVGFDAPALFAWVRDHTSLVPYRGALRGPRGVLMDRVGNSLDRSLLLYDLLSAAGEEVRLARAQLSPERASALLGELAAGPIAPAPTPLARSDADLERYAASGGVDAAVLRTTAAADDETRARFRAELDERVTEQAALLAELTGIPAEGAADTADAVGALRDHWWVQWRRGDAWVDLDLAASAETALAAAEATTQPFTLSDLDGALLHTVTLRLVAECWNGRELTRTELIDSGPLLPAELLGSRLSVRHVPIGWPDFAPAEIETQEIPEQRLELAASIEHWVPVLRVADEALVGPALSERCSLPDASTLSWPGTAEAVGGATDLFNTLPTGAEETEDAAVSLTAEWLEYEIRVPGQAPRVVRRQLFDRIGATARAGGGAAADAGDDWKLALLGQTDILLQPHRLSPAYAELLLGESILAAAEPLLIVAREAAQGPGETLDAALAALSFPPMQLFALALARQVDMPAEAYIAAPNILSHHAQFARTTGFTAVQSFDIVANELAIHPAAADAAGALRLSQGVRDTNAEALLARSQCEAVELTDVACTARPNAADRLASGADGWIPVTSAAELDALALATEPVGIREALAAGRVALVQTEGEAVWWDLDPVTGTALGMGADGRGQAAVEYAIALAANLASFIACDFGAHSAFDRSLCVAGFFLGWGGGIAGLVGATVASRVISVIGIFLSLAPVVAGSGER